MDAHNINTVSADVSRKYVCFVCGIVFLWMLTISIQLALVSDLHVCMYVCMHMCMSVCVFVSVPI